jgi:hypothetical protein
MFGTVSHNAAMQNTALKLLFGSTLTVNSIFYIWYAIQHIKYVGTDTPLGVIAFGIGSLILSLLALFSSAYFMGRMPAKINIFGLIVGVAGVVPFLIAAIVIIVRAVVYLS